jgi:hypothetical protein
MASHRSNVPTRTSFLAPIDLGGVGRTPESEGDLRIIRRGIATLRDTPGFPHQASS